MDDFRNTLDQEEAEIFESLQRHVHHIRLGVDLQPAEALRGIGLILRRMVYDLTPTLVQILHHLSIPEVILSCTDQFDSPEVQENAFRCLTLLHGTDKTTPPGCTRSRVQDHEHFDPNSSISASLW